MTVAQIEIRGGIDLELRALQWVYGAWLPRSRYVPDDQPGFEAWIGRPFAHGTEHFTGWLGTLYGTFYTTYSYTARFDGAVELHGRCHHPILGGSGDFAGVRGELSFTDVVDEEPFSYPYWGNIQLDRGTPVILSSAASSARLASARVASAATAPC